MQTELEAKFLHIDPLNLRQKLKAAGATLRAPERSMRRRNFDYPDGTLETRGGWVRVRDENDKVTLSYKQLKDRTITGTSELEITVSSFKHTCDFLELIGLQSKNYQETKRESWKLGQVEVEIDQWPWIDPFIELEGPSDTALKSVASQLGLDWDQALHGSVEIAYQAEYDVTEAEVNHWSEITFVPVPDWLKTKRRKIKVY